MIIPFLDLKKQYLKLQKEIDEALSSVISRTAFINGEEVSMFQKSFSDIYDDAYVVPLANGTDALFIAMKMLGIGPGDEVITTATSWISTSETISQTGATPVFVDIDEYYTIDDSKIRDAITEKTKAIIPVHLYGQMCNIEVIAALAKEFDLEVIEDCAQSHLSSYAGIKAGMWGKCGTFSFYPGKNLGAFGDAGALITRDEDFAIKCKAYANHGALIKHSHFMEGINSRMDTLQAAVLNVKVTHLNTWNKQRNDVAAFYLEELSGISALELPKIRENTFHSFHVFAVRTRRRDDLRDYLQKNGISTQVHYPLAMPFMDAYSKHHQDKNLFKNAKEHQDTELSLPIFPEMTKNQMRYVVDVIERFYDQNIDLND